MKKLRVTIEGKAYDVLVEVLDETVDLTLPAPALAQPPKESPSVAPLVKEASIPPVPKPSGSKSGNVECPLTGKVVSIDVKVGDSVKEGVQVATVEAMKMNTYIYAHRSGKVSAILVNAGDGVEEGVALISID